MRRSFLVLTLLLATVFGGGVARADDGDGLYTCKAVAPTSKIRATFSPEIDLKDMIAWVIGFSCKNVVASADVIAHAPKMVVVSPLEMTPKQALQLFVDAVESTGLVVTVKVDTIQIKLGPNMPLRCSDELSGSPYKPTPPPATLDTDGITKIDDTHYKVTRALAVKLAASPNTIVADMRVVASTKNGKPDGYKLYALRPTSLGARLGFLNGDTVNAINGFPILDAQQAAAILTKLKDATHIEVSITRRGQPLAIDITVQ